MLEKETELKDTSVTTSVDSFEYQINENSVTSESRSRRGTLVQKLKQKPVLMGGIVVVLVLTFVLTIMGVYTYAVARELQAQVIPLKAKAQTTYDLFKAQNLPEAEKTLNELETEFQTVKNTYQKLGFYSIVPIASGYYKDGLHGLNAAEAGLSAAKKSVTAVTPYADVLGFAGAEFTGGTTEDRLKVILGTLEKVSPILDDIGTDLNTVKSELGSINAKRYPETLKGIPVREYILMAQEMSAGAADGLVEYRPVIEQLPKVAGSGGQKKKYLILFQNDNELRPTGGFLTAYAIINVTDGKVEAEKSDDIYELDQKFTKNIAIPEELGRYLTTERYFNLRDMNISPDFKIAMDLFFENYKTVKGEPQDIDGIISVDTHFLTNLMKVLGPVEVPGYGTFTAENDTRCDCPQIIYILSEIITRPTPYLREDRKGILGPLMRSLLTKAYTAPKQTWPELFKTGFESIQNRHAQFYFIDQDAQNAAELANVAGRMTPPKNGEDFLGIVNANLAGAKSNLFITYEVKQTVTEVPVDGMITKTVEITYKNNHKADNCNLEAGLLCLNSTLKDWTRLYVPQGSQLVEAQGFLEEAKTYDENGFTVIDGFFTLEPLGSAKLSFTYTVPYENQTDYKVNIWKQGGIESVQNLMDITGGQEIIEVKKDTTYETFF
ncbi:MAG: hypothetical protein BroJett025_04490 [Patescibacteria group bacterium]|nr:MAG: hypothetical protein BroJett025_04490 [Patescibacteria group bacterium]